MDPTLDLSRSAARVLLVAVYGESTECFFASRKDLFEHPHQCLHPAVWMVASTENTTDQDTGEPIELAACTVHLSVVCRMVRWRWSKYRRDGEHEFHNTDGYPMKAAAEADKAAAIAARAAEDG